MAQPVEKSCWTPITVLVAAKKVGGRCTDFATTSFIGTKHKPSNLDDNKWHVVEPIFLGNEAQRGDSFSKLGS